MKFNYGTIMHSNVPVMQIHLCTWSPWLWSIVSICLACFLWRMPEMFHTARSQVFKIPTIQCLAFSPDPRFLIFLGAGQSLDCLDLPVWKFPATSLSVFSLFSSSKPSAWITESCVTPCWIRRLYMQWCTSPLITLIPLPIWFSSSSLRFPLAIYRLVVCQFLNRQ